MAQELAQELFEESVQSTKTDAIDFASELIDEASGILGGPEAEIRPPVEVPKKRIFGIRGGAVDVPGGRREELEARGFDVEGEEGGATAPRLAAQFGSVKDVKNALAAGTDFSPEEFEVIDVEGLGTVFKGPTDEKFRSLDPVGLDVGDIAPMALELAPVVSEVAALLATKHVGAAAAAGGFTRSGMLAAMKELGILEDPDIVQEGLIEAGLSLTGEVAPIIKRGLSAERAGISQIASRGTREQFQAGREQLGELATEVEQATGARPQFTVGEELGAVESEFAGPLIGTEQEAGASLAATRSQRQAQEALEAEIRGAPVEPKAIEELTTGIKGERIARVEQTTAQAEDVAQREIDRINAEVDKISGSISPKEIRSTMNKAVEDTRRSISNSYDQIRAEAVEVNVDLSGVGRVSQEIIEKARIFPNANTIFKDTLEASKGADGSLNSYQVAQEARSEIRAHIRRLELDKSAGAQVREAQQLEKEFSSAINDALSELDPALAQKLIETDTAFAIAKEKLEKGFVGKLIATREGEAVVPDEALVKTILGNTSDTQRFLNSAKEFFPEVNAKAMVKDAFYREYRNKVIDGSVPHNTFMKQIKDTGDLIFTPEELKVFNNAGAAKNKIKAIEKKRDIRIKEINKSFDFKLADKIEPHQLVDKISKSPQDTIKLKKILTEEEWGSYVDARRSKLIEDIFDSKGNISLSSLDNALKTSKRTELNLTLGPEYVKNLELAQKFVTVLVKRAKGVSDVKKASISGIDLLRGFVYGPISHEGFLFNMAKGFSKARTERAVKRMLNDQDLLSERIRIFKLPERKQQEELVNFWGAIGLPMATNRDADIETISKEEFDVEQTQ